MLFDREPVLIASLIRAGIVLATAFGLSLSTTQIGALVLFSEAALGVVVRRSVVSPASAASMSAAPPPTVATGAGAA